MTQQQLSDLDLKVSQDTLTGPVIAPKLGNETVKSVLLLFLFLKSHFVCLELQPYLRVADQVQKGFGANSRFIQGRTGSRGMEGFPYRICSLSG